MAPKQQAKKQQQQEQQQQPAEKPDEEETQPSAAAEEDSDDDDETSDTASVASSSSQASTGSSSNSKKKKKKKKKKSKPGDASGSSGAIPPAEQQSTSASKVDKNECEKRFSAAMETVRAGSEMWIKLSNCNIYDAKTKKLMEALKGNSSITSLDLSNNHISDEGVQAIASVLGTNGAPELIELDLRGNPLTPTGLTSLEGLRKIRKQLVVVLESPKPAVPEGEGMPPLGAGKELKDVSKGPMFRRYFQTGNDDDDDGGDEDIRVSDGGIAPELLWQQISEDVAAGTANIPQLGMKLQELSMLLTRELGTLQSNQDIVTDGSRPHIKGCIMNLETLGKVLSIVPRPVTSQFSSELQPAVGTHRVWAAEVVAQLVAPNISALDNLLASSKLPAQILQLALQHDRSSALQTRALRVLRSSCISKVSQLYAPLLTAGLGAGLRRGWNGGGEGENGGELLPSLQQQLAEKVLPALGVLAGKRPAGVGFALEACKVLLACCDEANKSSIYNANVARLLRADASWSEFIEAGGPLSQLCKEQEGDLGGPRAARMPMEDSAGDLAELAGGGLISGHEILALLQGMQVSGGLGSLMGN